jgi:asparagine synthase (glutamine-hydrolysing)
MCGIAGIVATAPIERQAHVLETLSQAQRHRGPDDWGFLTWSGEREGEASKPSLGRDAEVLRPGRVALVHRRLSIVDLTPGGWQPMLSANGRQAIVYNGEIYNYLELRAELEAGGRRLRSTSDTEILLTLLASEGEAALRRLVGMYAFAFLDLDRRRLTLARDPFGIKPLHYTARPGRVTFASEIRPLLAVGAAGREVDRAALFQFLRHGVTNQGSATVWKDVAELPPGHLAEIDIDAPGGLEPRPFWSLKSVSRGEPMTAGEAAAELRGRLINSVRLHLRADVPVAATLSGGIDSSGIVGAMRHVLGSGVPLPLFTYAADDEWHSEAHWASTMAAHVGAEIHAVTPAPSRLVADITALIATQEQPFTTTSMWAQAHVFRAVHESGYKVVLDGQGGDELFAGYPVFRAARLAALIERGEMSAAFRLLRAPAAGGRAMLPMALSRYVPERAQLGLRRLVGRPLLPAWLDGGWFGTAARPLPEVAVEAPTPLAAELVRAVTGSGLPMLLRYADRNAMAVSIENRVPYLTAALAEFAFSLPDELLIAPDGTLKWILREALDGLVPPRILERRDKVGFTTPEATWFERDATLRAWVEETAGLPLPPCFASSMRSELVALADGRARFAPHHWRAINIIRWSENFSAEFSAAAKAGAA